MERQIDFHVKNNDYFETLATSLDLVSQNLKKENVEYKKVLDDLVKELMYLRDNYTIINK